MDTPTTIAKLRASIAATTAALDQLERGPSELSLNASAQSLDVLSAERGRHRIQLRAADGRTKSVAALIDEITMLDIPPHRLLALKIEVERAAQGVLVR